MIAILLATHAAVSLTLASGEVTEFGPTAEYDYTTSERHTA